MKVDFFPKKGRQGLFPPRSFSTSEECPLPSQTYQQQIPSDHENAILKIKYINPTHCEKVCLGCHRVQTDFEINIGKMTHPCANLGTFTYRIRMTMIKLSFSMQTLGHLILLTST